MAERTVFRPPNAPVQFVLGLEGNTMEQELGPYVLKALDTIPHTSSYSPLLILDLTNKISEGPFAITIGDEAGKHTGIVFPDSASFRDYLAKKGEWKGILFIVSQLGYGCVSSDVLSTIKTEVAKKVADPGEYHVWFVESEIKHYPAVEPKDPDEIAWLGQRKKLLQGLWLCDVHYHPTRDYLFGWHEARLPEKTKTSEHDYSSRPEVKFCRHWIEESLAFRGAKILDDKPIRDHLSGSKSLLFTLDFISEGRGLTVQESCGCINATDMNGDTRVLRKCGKNNCFRLKPEDSSQFPIKLGQKEWYRHSSTCFDCSSGLEKQADLVTGRFDQEHRAEVKVRLRCPNLSCPAHKSWGAVSWVDPDRIFARDAYYNSSEYHERERNSVKKRK